MKKLYLFSVLILLLAACSTTESIIPVFSVDIAADSFAPEGGRKTISLTSNISWSASSSDDWLTVTPTKGVESTSITLSATKNNTPATRNCVVTLMPESGDPVKISISQSTRYEFNVDKTELIFPQLLDTLAVSLTSKTSWKVSFDADWLKVDPESGEGSSTLKFTASTNDNEDKRVTVVSLTPDVGDAIEISVTQKGMEDNVYDLYLLIGQSNMAGRGVLEKEDTTTHPRVFVLNSSDNFIIAKEPLHYDIANRGTGPGFEFGKKMADYYPSAKIGLIPAAVGGTKVTYWEKDHERDLLNQAILKTKEALKSGHLKGILWQQGESDSYSLDEAQAYSSHLLSILTDLRKEFGYDIPIVLGGLPDFLKAKYFDTINIGLQNIASSLNRVGYSEPSKLGHIGDNLHFNSKAQRENGRNMANKMVELQEGKSEKSLSVLVIGNSFSRNATLYLPQLAAEAGHKLVLRKAELSGGPLKMHWEKLEIWKNNPSHKDATPYPGNNSLYSLLKEQKWDIITMQQGSTTSAELNSYYPYINDIYDFIRTYQPDAKVVIHQTWAYRYDAPYFSTINGGKRAANAQEMYNKSREAYHHIAKGFGSMIIPTGDAFWVMSNHPKWKFSKDLTFNYKSPSYPSLPKEDYSLHKGYYWTSGKKFELDTHHASEAGCYLGALVWYSFLFQESPERLNFVPQEVKDSEFAKALKNVAWETYIDNR